MTLKWARAALSHPAFTGISRAYLADLIEELAGPWTASCESALHHRRGRKRKRQAGAGPKHELLFTDQVVVTLVYLRLQLPHAALAELYGMERSTITRAIGEIRPLLAPVRVPLAHEHPLVAQDLLIEGTGQPDVIPVLAGVGVAQTHNGVAGEVGVIKKDTVRASRLLASSQATTSADSTGIRASAAASSPGSPADPSAIPASSRPDPLKDPLARRVHPRAVPVVRRKTELPRATARHPHYSISGMSQPVRRSGPISR